MKAGFKIIIKIAVLVILAAFAAVFCYLFIGKAKPAENIVWGVNFSQKHSQDLKLDWKKTYLALMDDLGAKNIKIGVHWDMIEPEQETYYFNDLDWQINEAEKRGVDLIIVMGMKVPRWPECYLPEWAKSLSKEKQQEEILNYLEELVLRYKDKDSIKYWQVENEPFFPFGICPWQDDKFLKKEIDLVKSFDNRKRPIIVSDSGELSLWMKAAEYGDIVGSTLYRKVWSPEINSYASLPYPAVYYWRRLQLIKNIYGKNVICIELQAEPWGPVLLYDLALKEQNKTMDLKQFRKNIDFAKKTGLDTFYLWGAEWWYWLKENHNQPEIWNEAKELFLPAN